LFVIGTDVTENVIYVGEGDNHPGLYRKALRIAKNEIHWVDPVDRMKIGERRRYDVRIRYRQPLQKAELIMEEDALYILFDKPQRGITAGQFAAWYSNDIVVGSGVIK
jgi:tRNA-specific 2-thiouridylase